MDNLLESFVRWLNKLHYYTWQLLWITVVTTNIYIYTVIVCVARPILPVILNLNWNRYVSFVLTCLGAARSASTKQETVEQAEHKDRKIKNIFTRDKINNFFEFLNEGLLFYLTGYLSLCYRQCTTC